MVASAYSHKVDARWNGREIEIKGPAWKPEEAAPCLGPVRRNGLDSLPHNCAACKALGRTLLSLDCYATTQWQSHRKRIQDCRTSAAGAWLVCTGGGAPEVTPVACHSRFHDGCRSEDISERITSLALAAKEWEPGEGPRLGLFFGTLTFAAEPNRISRDLAWLRLWARWGRWRNLLRHAGVPLERFVVVVEPHPGKKQRKDGKHHTYSGKYYPHLHVVCLSRYWSRAESRKAKDLWIRCGGGHQFRWFEVKDNPNYIAKYLGKMASLPETLKALLLVHKIRLYNSSPGLKLAKRASIRTWKRMSTSAFRLWCAAKNS